MLLTAPMMGQIEFGVPFGFPTTSIKKNKRNLKRDILLENK